MTSDRPPGLLAPRPAPPVLVVGEGLVLDDGTGPRILLGGHLQSLPPQGDGPVVRGWDWDGLDDAERAGGSTWGDYVVLGSWDGAALALARAPSRPGDPQRPRPADEPPGPRPVPRGRVGTRRLAALQEQLHRERGGAADIGLLTSYVDGGRLHLLVVHDDGSLAGAFDQHLGPGAVTVASALRPAAAP